MPSRCLFLCFATVALVAQTQKFPLNNLDILGTQRYSLAAILRASGLTPGQPVDEASMQQAYERLRETGLFRNLQYRFKPTPNTASPAYDMVIEIAEGPAQSVVIDIPGVEPSAFWRAAAEDNPLLLPEMPEGEQALAYYERELTRLLAKSGPARNVRSSQESDLGSGKMTTIFHLEDAPTIAGLVFRNAKAVDTVELESAMRPALGARYSPRGLRRIVDLNLRPVYDDRGYLGAAFEVAEPSSLASGPVRPEIVIREGKLFKLRKMDVLVDGASSPELLKAANPKLGATAQWNRLLESAARAQRELQRQGYIASRTVLRKTLHPESAEAEIGVELTRGPQFVTGELILVGFTAKAEAAARKNWKLTHGAPFDLPYAEEFSKKAISHDDLRDKNGISVKMGPKGQTVNYSITVK